MQLTYLPRRSSKLKEKNVLLTAAKNKFAVLRCSVGAHSGKHCYAPINVKPQGGGGGGRTDPGEFEILMEARVKFPTPRHLLNVNFPPLG